MLSERLKLAMNRAQMSQAELARACGVKPPSVNGWLSGKAKFLKGENLLKAARALGVAQEWLATGRGEMVPTSATTFDVDHYEGTTPEEFLDNLQFQLDREIFEKRKGYKDTIVLPILDAVGSMGDGEVIEYQGDQIIKTLRVSLDWVVSKLRTSPDKLRIVTGAGDSMSPTFNDGDLLLVDTSVIFVNIDGIYVLSAQNRLFIKRVRQRLDGSYEISSDNPTVKTIDVLNGSFDVKVHGRVIWAWNGKKL